MVKSVKKLLEREMAKSMIQNQTDTFIDKCKLEWYIAGWKQKLIFMLAMLNFLFSLLYWGYKIRMGWN